MLTVLALVACSRPEPATAPAPLKLPGDGAMVLCGVGKPRMADGLTAERWPIVAATPLVGEPCIDIVRADLARSRLRAFTDPKRRTALAWRDTEHLLAVTNAGMFHEDGSPVGLVIDDNHLRGVDNPKFGGYLAWDPVAPGDPPVIAAGVSCPGFDLAALRRRYRSLVQSYRFLDCDGRALPWQDPKHYSAAGIGVDREGRVVFIHARAAMTMAELAVALAGHGLTGAIFLEGGPEASLVAGELALLGSYETGFVEHDDNREFWALPNVIGLVAR